MLTTSVYAGYQNNPPGISFMGKKTWAPGKTLACAMSASIHFRDGSREKHLRDSPIRPG